MTRLHGIELPDPYRWLEDEGADTSRWVEAQNLATDTYLAGLDPTRVLQRRLANVASYEQMSVPTMRAGRYFFLRTARSSNHAALVVSSGLAGPEETVVDGDGLSDDGALAIVDYVPSPDGRWVAVAITRGGSDVREWVVYDVARRAPTGDRIRWGRSARPSWTADSRGFYYAGSREADDPTQRSKALGQRVFFHPLGAPQSADAIVLELGGKPEWRPQPLVTADGTLLIVTVTAGVGGGKRVLVRKLRQPTSAFVELTTSFDHDFKFVASKGDVVWFATTDGAPRGHVVGIDVRQPNRSHWRVALPEQASVLQAVALARDRLVVATLQDSVSALALHSMDGKLLATVELPESGTIHSLRSMGGSDEVLFSLSSFRLPSTVYRLDARSRSLTTVHRPQVAFRASDFRTERAFVAGEGTPPLPVFLTARRDVPLRAGRPTYLTAYGGFGRATTPSFATGQMLWLELGGVLASAVVRGGGEYGERWHEAGKRRNKESSIEDFIRVADWLVTEGVTTREKLAMGGTSNGALLVAAALVRRPDVAAAAVVDVGLYDMARFHRLGVGWQWVDEYGSPDDVDDFRVLRGYSPYHNVRPETVYPSVLITTGDGDDRVAPAHSFKLAAALQSAQAGSAPILLRHASGIGHGDGVARQLRVRETALRWAFVAHALGLDKSDDPAAGAVENPRRVAQEALDEHSPTDRVAALKPAP